MACVGDASLTSQGLAEFAAGWLTFERGLIGVASTEENKARRRLTPIPPGWYDLNDESLCRLYSKAAPVRIKKIIARGPLSDLFGSGKIRTGESP